MSLNIIKRWRLGGKENLRNFHAQFFFVAVCGRRRTPLSTHSMRRNKQKIKFQLLESQNVIFFNNFFLYIWVSSRGGRRKKTKINASLKILLSSLSVALSWRHGFHMCLCTLTLSNSLGLSRETTNFYVWRIWMNFLIWRRNRARCCWGGFRCRRSSSRIDFTKKNKANE